MWFMPAWKGGLLPAGCQSADALSSYSRVFNSIEGNTTFYGLPAPVKVTSWQAQVAPDFRFAFKVPKFISHAQDPLAALHKSSRELNAFISSCAQTLGLLMLQLPASFGPDRLQDLDELLAHLADLADVPLAVEVRHPAFFDKGRAESALLRMLADRTCDRVIFDSRGLFADPSLAADVTEAQGKKPRLPVHPIATGNNPVLRFIGHSDWVQNERYLAQWRQKLAQWTQAGKTCWVFFHTASNNDAPAFARWACEQLGIGLLNEEPATDAGPAGDLFSDLQL